MGLFEKEVHMINMNRLRLSYASNLKNCIALWTSHLTFIMIWSCIYTLRFYSSYLGMDPISGVFSFCKTMCQQNFHIISLDNLVIMFLPNVNPPCAHLRQLITRNEKQANCILNILWEGYSGQFGSCVFYSVNCDKYQHLKPFWQWNVDYVWDCSG